MAKTRVRGNGPIEIIDSAGLLVALPLSALFFDGGQLQASGALYIAHKAAFDPLLQELSDEGLIVPDIRPPQPPAVVVTAKNPGAAGNNIQLTFSNIRTNPSDNTQTILDATLTQRDVYPDMDPTKLGVVLGTSSTTGGPAGLVFLSSSGTPTAPKEGTYQADTSGVVKVPKVTGSGNAFQLTFRMADAAAVMTVEVSASDAATGVFGLAATWTRTLTGIQISELDANANFGAMITAAAPPDGSLGVPTPGTIILTGGADATDAKPASATAMAAS
jgi:hypothetical protein